MNGRFSVDVHIPSHLKTTQNLVVLGPIGFVHVCTGFFLGDSPFLRQIAWINLMGWGSNSGKQHNQHEIDNFERPDVLMVNHEFPSQAQVDQCVGTCQANDDRATRKIPNIHSFWHFQVGLCFVPVVLVMLVLALRFLSNLWATGWQNGWRTLDKPYKPRKKRPW